MSSALPRIRTAALQWKDGAPVSTEHNDVYFSSHDGLAECRDVFMRGNRLAERWADRPRRFVIGETGFGSGLNFLATCLDWLKYSDHRACLHYCAVEYRPFAPQDARRTVSRWAELADLWPQWLAVYPPPVYGFHHSALFGGRVRLTLAYMDIAEWIGQIRLAADAWYLDGFAPARNAAMWDDAVLDAVGANTAARGTFATFTAAGTVRRRLAAAFEVDKAPGFGGKREMLRGTKRPGGSAGGTRPAAQRPWFALAGDRRAASTGSGEVTVIGAGLAGAWTADALARRGWSVHVLDRHDEPAAEASGNALGVVFARFSAFRGIGSRFHQQAYLHAVSRFQQTLTDSGLWARCGMLQIGVGAAERRRQQALIDAGIWPSEWLQPLSAAQAGRLAGLPLRHGGWYWPQSGWLAPPRVCARLLDQPGVDWRPGRAVHRLEYCPATARWRLLDAEGGLVHESAVVILANAAAATDFEPTAYLPLKRIRGQASELASTAASAGLRTVLCYDGYLTPAVNGRHGLGATFDPDSDEARARRGDDAINLQRLAEAEPEVYKALCRSPGHEPGPAVAESRAGFRCYTPDRLPVVGPVPDLDYYRRAYAPLAKGQLKGDYPLPQFRPGLYVNVAHGARGITSTPLSAELLAAYLCGEPPPVPEAVRVALHPARFPVKRLKQGGC